MNRIILDTDPGIDDALAIILALNSPEIQVEAITTVAGNVSQKKAHLNALKLLEFLRIDNIPVAKGAVKPILRDVKDSEGFHGPDGLGDAVLPKPKLRSFEKSAIEIIREKADELCDELIIVAIGPLTNIASFILAYPNIAVKIRELIIMGGAFNLTPYGYGNVTPVAEFNIWIDPEAAKIVFNSSIPITAIGLDVTTNPKNGLSKELFEKIIGLGTKKSNLIFDLCKRHINRVGHFNLHDPLAVAAAVDQSIIKTDKFVVDVETVGELTRGQTIVDKRHLDHVKTSRDSNVNICIDVNSESFLKIFSDRIVDGQV